MTTNVLNRDVIATELLRNVVMKWTDELYNFHFNNEYPNNEHIKDYHPEILDVCIGKGVDPDNVAEIGLEKRIDLLRCYINTLAQNAIPYVIMPNGDLKGIERVEAEVHNPVDFRGIEPDEIHEIAKKKIEKQIVCITLAHLYLESIEQNKEIFSENCKNNSKPRYTNPIKYTNPKLLTETIENIYSSAIENESNIFNAWEEFIKKYSLDVEKLPSEISDIPDF